MKFKTLQVVFLAMASFGLIGCAHYGQDNYFEKDVNVKAAQEMNLRNQSRASVYFLRPSQFGEHTSTAVIRPLVYALDGRLLSIMPTGSYALLSLAPGKHTFTLVRVEPDFWERLSFNGTYDLELTVEAGKTYYVGFTDSLFWKWKKENPMKLYEESSGREVVSGAQLVKFIINPATIEQYAENWKKLRAEATPAREKSASTPTAPGTPVASLEPTVQNSSESGISAKDFFEGLAYVLLFAFLLVGAAGNAQAHADIPSLAPPRPPSNYAQSAPPTLQANPKPFLGSGISNTQGNSIYGANGVNYQVVGNNILGSDGSVFTVQNSMIYSSNGQVFQASGGRLQSSDGRLCTPYGNTISCN
jgi:hypothetical protein